METKAESFIHNLDIFRTSSDADNLYIVTTFFVFTQQLRPN